MINLTWESNFDIVFWNVWIISICSITVIIWGHSVMQDTVSLLSNLTTNNINLILLILYLISHIEVLLHTASHYTVPIMSLCVASMKLIKRLSFITHIPQTVHHFHNSYFIHEKFCHNLYTKHKSNWLCSGRTNIIPYHTS